VDAVVDQLLLGRVVVVEGGQDGHPGLGPAGPDGGPLRLAGLGADLVGQPLRPSRPDLGRRRPSWAGSGPAPRCVMTASY